MHIHKTRDDQSVSGINRSESWPCVRENAGGENPHDPLSFDQEILFLHTVADRIDQFAPLNPNGHSPSPHQAG